MFSQSRQGSQRRGRARDDARRSRHPSRKGILSMASVYEKRGTWYLRYKDERGHWMSEASSVRTKGEARRLANDLEQKAERVRKGLEPALVAAGDQTVGEIVTWWLETIWIGRPSYKKAKSAISG